jgi:RHS repeat-associated protein
MGQTCPPNYPITVTSFTLAPSQINGDGHETARGTVTVKNTTGSTGVDVCLHSTVTSFHCMLPAFFDGGSFACGCVLAGSSTSFDVEYTATVGATNTFPITASVDYPINPPGCIDPGKTQSLTAVAPVAPDPPLDLPCVTCALAGAPINLTNGDTWIEETDYSLPGLGGGITLTRTWNSLWPSMGPVELAGTFGHSWRSTFNERLQTLAGGGIKYWRANGSAWLFSFDSLNHIYTLTAPFDEVGSLAFDSGTAQYTLTYKDGTQHVFNNAGYLAAMIDRNGNTESIAYDASNRITQVTDAAARSITFSYNDANNPNQATSVQDVTGTIATYTYVNTLLTEVTYADGSVLNFAYDASQLILSVTDAQNKVYETHTYDGQRRGATSARANGVDLVTIFYPSTTYTQVKNSSGFFTTYTFASKGGRGFITYVNGQGCATCGFKTQETQSFNYDGAGKIVAAQRGSYNPEYYTYDAAGNLIQKQVVLNNQTSTALIWAWTYNTFGEVLTATDPLGHITVNTYDPKGNLLTTTTPSPDGGTTAGSVTTFTYDAAGKGLLSTIKDPLNHVTTITYFPSGLIQTIKDPLNHITTYAYDARGNRNSVTDALNKVTTFGYDIMNRLTSITYPTLTATTVTFGLDYRGRRQTVTDQTSKVTTYGYDDADRLTTVTDAQTPAHGVTIYDYDTENNLKKITDALLRQTLFDYDNGGQVTKVTFPSTLAETYIPTHGDVTQKTDRKGQIIKYNYDNFHRLFRKTYPDSSTVEYTYEGMRLQQVVDATGTYTFAYDDMDRLKTATVSYAFLPMRTFTVNYTYDKAGNRKTMTDPESGVATYTYDNANRLTGLQDFQLQNYTLGYSAVNSRLSLTRPNSVATTYTYDNIQRLTGVTHKLGTTVLDGATYTYDAAGNRKTRTDQRTSTTLTYGYDNIYQLLSAKQGTTTKETYTYDRVGNRLSSLGVTPYVNNTSNELTSIPGTTYTYDNNGNMATKTDATGVTTYTWDYENRLVAVALPGAGGSVAYKYDPFGRRVQKAFTQGSTTTTTNYIYDGMNVLEEVDNSGSVLARYTQGNTADEPLMEVRAGATSYYEADGLGSVTSLSTTAGALANTYIFDSYGRLTASTGTVVNPFQYTGREWDVETGAYYNRNRYYDPTRGRFFSEDPLGFMGGPNFYDYVNNEPTSFTDPLGLSGSRPGGPYHPPSGVTTRCNEGDSCERMKGKMWVLGRMISSHVGWDIVMPPPRGGGRHGEEIANLWIQLAQCQALYQKKCKSDCNKQKPPRYQPDPWWSVFWETFWDGVREDQWEIEYALTHPNQISPAGLPMPTPLPVPVPVIP